MLLELPVELLSGRISSFDLLVWCLPAGWVPGSGSIPGGGHFRDALRAVVNRPLGSLEMYSAVIV